jgi:hypothetical protein
LVRDIDYAFCFNVEALLLPLVTLAAATITNERSCGCCIVIIIGGDTPITRAGAAGIGAVAAPPGAVLLDAVTEPLDVLLLDPQMSKPVS